MKWQKIIIAGLVIIWLALNSPAVKAAAPRFEVTTDVTYKVHDSGKTTVTQNFYLTNLTSEFAPDEYITKLPVSDPANIRAFDSRGTLPVEVKDDNIHLRMPATLAGAGQTYSWTLVYTTEKVAIKEGRLWVIQTAKPADVEGLVNSYSHLEVPPSFGRVVFDNGNKKIYDPLSLANPYQVFDFKIRYRLYNPKLYPATTTVYLPPDTISQKVFLETLDPKPINISFDENGNWIARYQLGPAGKLEVEATGSVGVFNKPVFAPLVPALTALTEDRKTIGIVDNNLTDWETRQTDFDHIALMFNQEKFYKPEVDFRPVNKDLDFTLTPKVGLRVDVPRQIIAGFPAAATVFIENYGPTSFTGEVIKLTPSLLKVRENGLAAGPLAPFATQALRFTILPGAWNQAGSDIISLKFAQEERSYQAKIVPFFKNNFVLTVVILVSLGIISVIAQIARSLLFPKQKR